MLKTSEYETNLPIVRAALEKLRASHMGIGDDSNAASAMLQGSEYEALINQTIKTVERDIYKADDEVGAWVDEVMRAEIRKLQSVAGSAPNGKVWHDGCTEPATPLNHSNSTLDLISVQQICDRVNTCSEKLEAYAIERSPGKSQDAVMRECSAQLIRAIVPQFEMVIMRTRKTSSKPVARVQSAFSFSQRRISAMAPNLMGPRRVARSSCNTCRPPTASLRMQMRHRSAHRCLRFLIWGAPSSSV